jgi:hypothetical protein
MKDNKLKKELVDSFVDFIVKSSKSELDDLLEYLKKENIAKTLTGVVLTAFISGYIFALNMNRKEKE